MSDATDFLRRWIALAQEQSPTITVVTAQANPDTRPGTAYWAPGIAGFHWGINGRILKDAAGRNVGLAFGELYSFFSDRIVSGTQSVWPWEAQRFDARARDKMALEFVLDGNDVRVDATLLTWGNAKWSARTNETDGSGHQLYFPAVQPAGPRPTSAVLLASFQPTGRFGFL